MWCGSQWVGEKRGCCKSEKAALSQGGFLWGRVFSDQLHAAYYA
jgi:hypothetical protein